ncbi:hypothetical protein NVP1265O_18 [Vibrio phage 1.265.O._10N.286.52.F6]|nr:hypothetical protein NVP1265O_18 [Vibrio phage 1.265.O._10N.286.52.F6]
MSYYTTQQTMSFSGNKEYSSIIPDPGASITVEFWNGNEYVTDSKSPITESTVVFTQNNVIRFTPTTGGFHIDEGSRL